MTIKYSGDNITFSDNSVQNTAATGFGFKNRIINGAMGIWQRGTSFNVAWGGSAYTCDRWMLYAAGGACTATQSTDVPSTAFKYSTLCSGLGVDIIQRIESANCFDLVGQNITVSFWMKQTVGAGANSMTVALQSISAADNWSSTISNFATTTITPTSSWAQYTVTFTNLPAGVANGLSLSFYPTSSASSSTFYITGVQLEKGSTATSFDYRPYGTELSLCQRYYYKLFPAAVSSSFGINGYAFSTTSAPLSGPFPVPMRTAPTALDQSGTAGDYAVSTPAGVVACSSVPTISTATNAVAFQVNFTVASGLTTGQSLFARTSASTGSNAYLGWSAEL